MDAAYLSALSALAGSVVGGLISGVATWLSQHEQTTSGRRAHDRSRLEDLYKDFIIAATKAYGHALTSNDPELQEIVALYGMISRMRVLSSPRILACAERIMQTIMGTYFAPNKTIRELHNLIKSGGGPSIDPLKEFGELVREELRTF
jgi:hypothetical protein